MCCDGGQLLLEWTLDAFIIFNMNERWLSLTREIDMAHLMEAWATLEDRFPDSL